MSAKNYFIKELLSIRNTNFSKGVKIEAEKWATFIIIILTQSAKVKTSRLLTFITPIKKQNQD